MKKVVFEFYKDKRVLITGSSGFKGSWLSEVLLLAGANVLGVSLPPERLSLCNLLGHPDRFENQYVDIADYEKLNRVVVDFNPHVVFHLAAQPIVLVGYREPVRTYLSNVMGTVNLLQSLRQCTNLLSVLNVTTDKVYKNNEWCWGYRENEALDGYDPYSNSKSCSELVTSTFKRCYFDHLGIPVSTARAGNVIGGGDFSLDRIIPDCVRAAVGDKHVLLRNPSSTRPYQHVLEPIFAYLLLAQKQAENKEISGAYNVGPHSADAVKTSDLVARFCELWGEGMSWSICESDKTKHEASFLKLDISKIKALLNWSPCWGIEQAIKATVDWEKARLRCSDLVKFTQYQILSYLEEYDDKKISS